MFRSHSRFLTVSKKRLFFDRSVRLHAFSVKTTSKRMRKGWILMVTFYSRELYSWSQSWFSSFKERSFFLLFYVFTRSFFTENACKRTERSKSRRFSLTLDNHDRERNTLSCFLFYVLFCAFKRVFHNFLSAWVVMNIICLLSTIDRFETKSIRTDQPIKRKLLWSITTTASLIIELLTGLRFVILRWCELHSIHCL